MVRKSSRGRGSNQYADKAQTSAVEENAKIERVRKMKNLTGIQHKPSGATGSDLGHVPTAALTTGLSSSVDAQIKHFLSKNDDPQEMLSKVKAVSAFEDSILTRHNNAYGHAVVEGIHFVKDAKYNPEIREAIKRDDSPEKVLLEGYGKIIGDALEAPGAEIPLEELPEILDRLNDATIARDRGESWGKERRSEPTLSSRFAATSVYSSRDPENPSLLRELTALRNQLHERGASKIDI
jgi:hypothetical protein